MNLIRQNFVEIAVILAVFIAIFVWLDWHDKQVAISAERYEKCVLDTYRTTPAYWYAEHGEYPICPQTSLNEK